MVLLLPPQRLLPLLLGSPLQLLLLPLMPRPLLPLLHLLPRLLRLQSLLPLLLLLLLALLLLLLLLLLLMRAYAASTLAHGRGPPPKHGRDFAGGVWQRP